jgi:hypothetical protein
MKSLRQDCFIAFCCAAVGALVGAAAVATGFGAGAAAAARGGGATLAFGGGTETTAGVAVAGGGGGAAASVLAGGATAGAGAAAGASAGFAATGAGGGNVALTAVLQAADRPATFFCRQASASLPPGVTPEHFDMKSERQEDLIAFCCADVTCAMAALPSAIMASPVRQGSNAQWPRFFMIHSCCVSGRSLDRLAPSVKVGRMLYPGRILSAVKIWAQIAA